jgi:hypothetical protein
MVALGSFFPEPDCLTQQGKAACTSGLLQTEFHEIQLLLKIVTLHEFWL